MTEKPDWVGSLPEGWAVVQTYPLDLVSRRFKVVRHDGLFAEMALSLSTWGTGALYIGRRLVTGSIALPGDEAVAILQAFATAADLRNIDLDEVRRRHGDPGMCVCIPHWRRPLAEVAHRLDDVAPAQTSAVSPSASDEPSAPGMPVTRAEYAALLERVAVLERAVNNARG